MTDDKTTPPAQGDWEAGRDAAENAVIAEHAKIGAVDGYDYLSGKEAGLHLALTVIRALRPAARAVGVDGSVSMAVDAAIKKYCNTSFRDFDADLAYPLRQIAKVADDMIAELRSASPAQPSTVAEVERLYRSAIEAHGSYQSCDERDPGMIDLRNAAHSANVAFLTALRSLASPAPTQPAQDVEDIAKLIYKAMRWAVRNAPEPPFDGGDWVERGNSFAQTEARRAAREITDALSALAAKKGV